MGKQIHVLIVEDSEDDTALIVEELKAGGYDPFYERVETSEALEAALLRKSWDVMISDYFMPRFSAPEAMRRVQKAALEIPFIIITGSAGEEAVVAAMKAGAHDYLMKDNLARLCPAIEREMKDAESRRARQRAEEALRESRQQLRCLAARLDSLRESERAWIAREIHDEFGQVFTSIKIDLSLMQKTLLRPKGLTKKALTLLRDKIESMSLLADRAIQTVRKIATELRPAVLDDLGLIAAIEWQKSDFETRSGISCRIETTLEGIDFGRECATAVFRIFQETLTNVARHANATLVNVRIEEKEGQFFLHVEDNGRGISGKEISDPASLGLLGMRERALLLNGEVSISGISGKGTRISLRIPLNKREGHVEPGKETVRGRFSSCIDSSNILRASFRQKTRSARSRAEGTRFHGIGNHSHRGRQPPLSGLAAKINAILGKVRSI